METISTGLWRLAYLAWLAEYAMVRYFDAFPHPIGWGNEVVFITIVVAGILEKEVQQKDKKTFMIFLGFTAALMPFFLLIR